MLVSQPSSTSSLHFVSNQQMKVFAAFLQYLTCFSMVLCSSVRYMVLSNLHDAISTRSGKLVRLHNNTYIFERVGILLHGKHSFCMKFAKVFKVRIRTT